MAVTRGEISEIRKTNVIRHAKHQNRTQALNITKLIENITQPSVIASSQAKYRTHINMKLTKEHTSI